MNVYIFIQVSPLLRRPLQLYALHGPMFLFVDCLGFSLSPLLTPQGGTLLHALANSFHQHKHCVTTWREPQRRRTEKSLSRSYVMLQIFGLFSDSVDFSTDSVACGW